MVSELWGFAPELLLLSVGALLPLVGAFDVEEHWIAALALAAIGGAGYLAAGYVWTLPGLEILQTAVAENAAADQVNAHFYGSWFVNPFAVFFKLVFLSVAGLVVLGSVDAIDSEHMGEYHGLLLLATVGTLAVASSADLVTLFIGLELSSFATYALAGFYKDESTSSEAALKYFIVGSLSSAIALYGISLAYGVTGSVSWAGLQIHFQQVDGFSSMALFTWVFLFAGFGFKITAVPFHLWAPDTYTGSPAPVSGFLAAGTKKAGFVALFKIFLLGFIALQASWTLLLGVVAVATMTVGNLVALRQDDVKRLLAYSSVAHAGYMLIGLIVATEIGVAGSLFHILTHGFMKAGAFVAVGALAAAGVRSTLDEWQGLGTRAPVTAFALAIFMVSFTGIPPLAGFASKFVLFASAINKSGWFVALAVAGIVNSAISLYYYARVIRTMYVDDAPAGSEATLGLPRWAVASVVVAALFTVVVGVYPQPVVDFAFEAAEYLVN